MLHRAAEGGLLAGWVSSAEMLNVCCKGEATFSSMKFYHAMVDTQLRTLMNGVRLVSDALTCTALGKSLLHLGSGGKASPGLEN